MPYLQKHDGIKLYALVGVFEWERKAERPLVFDLQFESDQPPTLTRKKIEQHMKAWLISCRYRLLEALAEHLVQCMLTEWQCNRVMLSIEKPGALGDLARVGIRITRRAIDHRKRNRNDAMEITAPSLLTKSRVLNPALPDPAASINSVCLFDAKTVHRHKYL